jgi:hypothetical protein
MDYFEALTRKRACRAFTDEPVSEAHVERLLYAASWAPIASNRPYRHCIVVDDPRVIQAIRQISPSLQSSPPLLIVIYSDLEMAHASVGQVGDRCTAVDAGAAGENVLLAATALGLGAQFTMISAMSGIRTILGSAAALPRRSHHSGGPSGTDLAATECRQTEPRAACVSQPVWSRPMSAGNRDEWFTYTSFLASSARAGIEESVVVSSHRLIEALRRLLDLMPELKQDPFYREIDELLAASTSKAYFKSPEKFTEFLDEVLQRFAAEARVRNGLD